VSTRWPAVAAVLLAGYAASAQIGKVPASMTTIGAELGLDLAGAALLVGLFGLLAGIGGLAIGLAASRVPARTALLAGLGSGAVAAAAGALAPGLVSLFAARVAEGAGFSLVAVTAPALIATLAASKDRAFAMGLWGTFMPGGIALGLLSAPVVEAFGWRTAWLGCAALLVAAALLCFAVVPRGGAAAPGPRPPMRGQLRAVVAARRPLLVSGAFATYNIVYIGIAVFLPAYLESLGQRTGVAGAAAAAAAVCNALGNVGGAVLMGRGMAPERLVIRGAAVMGVLAASVFLLPSVPAALALAMLASVIGGVVPAACFALIPRAVPDPSLVPPAVGLTIQNNNLMQLLAPPALGALAALGWPVLALPMLAGGAAAAALGLRLTRRGLPTVPASP